MPKPDTALVFGMEPIKDLRRDVVAIGPTCATIAVYNTGGLRACAMHIYPHTSPAHLQINRCDPDDYLSSAWLKGDMYHDFVLMLGEVPSGGAPPHYITLLSPTSTTVTVHWAILAS